LFWELSRFEDLRVLAFVCFVAIIPKKYGINFSN
jgi:hypothetical protein